ncbi:hypothetical protein J6590_066132 [Homalodisca vitripennis]|nr:hypothetical protein J6590_066132 [Homalodisca vitripennis]
MAQKSPRDPRTMRVRGDRTPGSAARRPGITPDVSQMPQHLRQKKAAGSGQKLGGNQQIASLVEARSHCLGGERGSGGWGEGGFGLLLTSVVGQSGKQGAISALSVTPVVTHISPLCLTHCCRLLRSRGEPISLSFASHQYVSFSLSVGFLSTSPLSRSHSYACFNSLVTVPLGKEGSLRSISLSLSFFGFNITTQHELEGRSQPVDLIHSHVARLRSAWPPPVVVFDFLHRLTKHVQRRFIGHDGDSLD